MKRIIAIVIVLGVGAATVWYTTKADDEGGTSYRFVSVETGDVESVVSSTGNLGAIRNVQVGTQVSGIVNEIYVDFNSEVYRGQLLARIDTTLLVSAIRESRANIERIQAQQRFASVELARIQGLFDKHFATEVELNQARYNLEIADASVKSAEISLERSERNLSYATIYSPIDGVVIERNVEPGQTVAASLSAPQLFLIANDLRTLQILASVDESDIGIIEEGQRARFTVQAHDDVMFEGIVRQVRLQSTVQENVVTYTVVVDVDNSDNRLLPGMTATVDFIIETAEGVLKVPNAALRFRPTQEMMAAMREREAARNEADGDSTRSGDSGPRRESSAEGRFDGGQGSFGRGQGDSPDAAQLWYFDKDGRLAVTRVRRGISDGQSTHIIGRGIEEDMQVIAGVTSGATTTTTTNPFQSQQSGRRRGSGGF